MLFMFNTTIDCFVTSLLLYILGKADRDPNRPKKAMSAYFIFMGDYRNHCKMTGESNTSNVGLRLSFFILCDLRYTFRSLGRRM